MNKIQVEEKNLDIILEEDTFLDIKKNTKLNIKVKNNKLTKLLIISLNNRVDININLEDNKNIEINSLGINTSINYNFNINNNCNLILTDSILTKNDSLNNIKINSIGQNNYSKILTNGINLDTNKLYFELNGIINKESINSVLTEESKIINIQDGDSKIIPNLIIDTKEVVANHSAFIGTFNKNELFYLMSRGIKKKDSINLLTKSILLKGMEIDKERILKEINNYL